MENLLSQYYRYIIAGVIVTALDFFILAVCTELFNIYYLLSACIAFVFAGIVQYFISIKYVFNFRKFQNAYYEFTVFFIIGVVSLIIFESLMYWLTDLMKFHYLYSKVIVTGILFTFNFASRKLILFR